MSSAAISLAHVLMFLVMFLTSVIMFYNSANVNEITQQGQESLTKLKQQVESHRQSGENGTTPEDPKSSTESAPAAEIPASTDNNEPLKLEEFAVITATSDNHLDENAKMLLSLREVQYKGPIFIFIMMSGNDNKDKLEYFKTQVAQCQSLDVRLVDYWIDEGRAPVKSYCFKPHAIQQTLDAHPQIKALFWSDSSTRFRDDPFRFGQRLIEDGVMFGGRTSILGMAENTDPRTYAFLQKNKEDYYQFTEIAATQWAAVVHPRDEQSFYGVLRPWFDCASLENCRQCMAPNLNTKMKKRARIQGPGGLDLVAPRQDQAVLGLLIYEQILKLNHTAAPHGRRVDLGSNPRYMNLVTGRNDRIRDIALLNGPVTPIQLPP